MAEWVKSGGAIPKSCVEIIPELCEPTYTFKGDKLLLEPKEQVKVRLGRSPDIADALALTFAATVAARKPHEVMFENVAMRQAARKPTNPFKRR